MISIDVNIVRFGNKDDPSNKTIGKMFIWNEGPVSLHRCEYGYMILHPEVTNVDHPRDAKEGDVWVEGFVDHTRSDGIWWLVQRVFKRIGEF